MADELYGGGWSMLLYLGVRQEFWFLKIKQFLFSMLIFVLILMHVGIHNVILVCQFSAHWYLHVEEFLTFAYAKN